MAAACFPRTPPVKSYSGRIVSGSALCGAFTFFIRSPFSACGKAAADEAEPALSLRIADHQETSLGGQPESEIPLFAQRVVGIGNHAGQRILQYRRGLVKSDTVVPSVGLRFVLVPLKLGAGLAIRFHPSPSQSWALPGRHRALPPRFLARAPWQRDGERGSMALGTLHGELPPVRRDNFLYDIQP